MTPERWQQVKHLLDQSLDQEPGARVAFVTRACQRRRRPAARDRALPALRRAGRGGRLPGGAGGGPPRARDPAGRAPDRSLPGGPRARPRRHGHGLPRRAGRRGVRAAGGDQDRQARHGHRRDRPPLPPRAPDPRPAGAPQHRPPARRRHHRGGALLPGDGVRRGSARSRPTAARPSCRSATGWSCSGRSARQSISRTSGWWCTATSSRATSW